MQAVKRPATRLVPKPILARIRASRQRRLIERFTPYVASHSYGDHLFRIAIEDPLAQGWYDHDWDVLPEIDLLRTAGHLRQGARVFDLGAHQGVVALMLAAEVGESGSVIAVEATAHNAAVAERNSELNGTKNVIVLHAAAAGAEGVLSFAASLNGSVGRADYAFSTVEVPAVTIDSLALSYGPPDVVFIDVEGYEQKVLAGAKTTFDRRPDWFVEIHAQAGLEDAGGSVTELIASFTSRPYQLFVGDPGGGPFQPLVEPVPDSRFYLIALSRLENERYQGANLGYL